MIWIATLNDDSKISEYKDGIENKFDNLDKSKIKSFKIFENVNDMNVSFSSTTGIVKFPNFDLEKLNLLENKCPLNLEYDENGQCFKLTEDSLKLYNQLILKDEKFYDFVEIMENGMFNISGSKFYLTLETNGEAIPLIGQSPYNDIIHYKEASTEFQGNPTSVVARKRTDKVNAYVIGFNKNHRHKQLQVNLSLKIIYNIASKCIVFEGMITCNETVTGNLHIHYGDKISSLSATFMKDLPTKVDRLVTII